MSPLSIAGNACSGGQLSDRRIDFFEEVNMRTAFLAILLAVALPYTAFDSAAGNSFKGTTAYCYLNKDTLTWRIGNDAVERKIQFDRDVGGLKTLHVKDKLHGRLGIVPGNEGEVVVSGGEEGGGKTLNLSEDWVYQWQSVATPPHGGRLLTVHMWGKGVNKGYEVEVMYEVQPGNRPFLAKSVTLINRTSGSRTLEQVLYDRWLLVGGGGRAQERMPQFLRNPDGTATLVDAAGRGGLLSGVPGGTGETALRDGALVQSDRPKREAAKEGGRAYSAKAVIMSFSGPAENGRSLFRQYTGGLPAKENHHDRQPAFLPRKSWPAVVAGSLQKHAEKDIEGVRPATQRKRSLD